MGHPSYRVEGYDYLGFTIYHHYLNEADYRKLIQKQYLEIAGAANASGVFWMIGEAYFPWGEPGFDLDEATTAFLKNMQQTYLDISLDEYLKFRQPLQPYGYIFIGYFMEGIEVKDSPSEPIIKDYFTRIN